MFDIGREICQCASRYYFGERSLVRPNDDFLERYYHEMQFPTGALMLHILEEYIARNKVYLYSQVGVGIEDLDD